MHKGIPSPDLHNERAVNKKGDGCRCGGTTEGQHHDHLANYAFDMLQHRLVTECGVTYAEADAVWRSNFGRFLDNVRFDPEWLCSTCNSGDGDGKRSNWAGLVDPIYPDSFSLTSGELALVRAMGRRYDTTGRRKALMLLWERRRDDHENRRKRMKILVAELVNDRRG